MEVILSIKPKYAEMILCGEKKYEFRRTIFKSPSVSKIVIYASSPISSVIGEFEVDQILSLDILNLWQHTSEYSGIEKDFFDSYFAGKDIGHAIKVKSVKRYDEHKNLDEYNIKRAPQSFAYIRSAP